MSLNVSLNIFVFNLFILSGIILAPSAQAEFALSIAFPRFAQKNGFIVSEPIVFDDESQMPGYSPNLKEASRTTFRNGLVYNSRGQLLDSTAAGIHIYVLSDDGILYVSPIITQGGRVHHSYFLMSDGIGEKVACAGEISLRDGKITSIDTNSGHYRPIKDQLKLAVQYLHRQGVFARNVEIRDTGTKFRDPRSNQPTGVLSIEEIMLEDPQAILKLYPASVERTPDFIESSKMAISNFIAKVKAFSAQASCPKFFVNSPASYLFSRFGSPIPTQPGRLDWGVVDIASKKWRVILDNYYWQFPENISNAPVSEFRFGSKNEVDTLDSSWNGYDIKIGACKYSISHTAEPQKTMVLWLAPQTE